MAKKSTSRKASDGAEATPAPKRTAKKKVAKLASKLKDNLLSKIAPSSREDDSATGPAETAAASATPQSAPVTDPKPPIKSEPPVQAAPAPGEASIGETKSKRTTRKAPAKNSPARPVEAATPTRDGETSVVTEAPAVAEAPTREPAQEVVTSSPAEEHVIGQRQVTFTHSEIALRAYFIAQERQAKGLPGDAHADWLEAERQIRDESREESNQR